MDVRNGGGEKNLHVFNVGLSKLIGLYQILDPGTARLLGQNVYRIFAASFVLYSCAVGTVAFVSSLYYWKDNALLSMWYFWVASSSLYVCFKMWIVLYRSDDIWHCLRITRYGFTSSLRRRRDDDGRYDRILDGWRARSVRYTNLLACSYALSTTFYVGYTLASGDDSMPIRNRDGSVGNYRQNVFNLHFSESDDAYNDEYYDAFFVLETLFVLAVAMFFAIFDVLLMTLCFAICGQMQIICTAFESVNHKPLVSGPDSSSIADYTDEERNTSNEHDLIYEELKTIIINHQAVIKIYELFLNVFERVMLIHIFVTSILLIIMWFMFIVTIVGGATFVTYGALALKIIVPIPAFSFQIFVTCYLFENLHNQKDSIIFALYSSNWTEMNMKCKKLILLTMKMNNANQKKLKFTKTKIVNLEMFFKTMRDCYTVLSVLINYIKTNSD